ncbi:MAG: hypothetical protein JYX80_12780 [Candidatus Scalindua sediminis]|nr:hypothetical protein [Candidatus Scalindua sediminis]
MSYFRERNKTRNEYSGYQEVSDGLRSRLSAICERYTAKGLIGSGQGGFWIPARILNHEIKLYLNKADMTAALVGKYDEVFEAVEIFLYVAKTSASRKFPKILVDVISAFNIAGSVYQVDPGTGQVELRIEDKLAADIEAASDALSETRHARNEFLDAVGGLMSRNKSPEEIVNDIFVAFEDYLKTSMHAKEYGEAVTKLVKEEIISPTQKSLLEKIYAYRSDTYGVVHAGKGNKPKEIDALWFLETVTAQILFLDRKLKQLQ